MNFEIKRAEEKDEDQLKSVLIKNNQKPTIIINQNSLYYFAMAGDEIIGLAGAEISNEYALIRSVAILENWRNNGISHMLVRELFDNLKKRGVKHLYLFSRDTGLFWQKLGFLSCTVQDIIGVLPAAPQVAGYIADNSIWTDVAWYRSIDVR